MNITVIPRENNKSGNVMSVIRAQARKAQGPIDFIRIFFFLLSGHSLGA